MVREIMMEFANRTGLVAERATPRRYLWTDAFAVCNYLALSHQTGDPRYTQLALHLVDQVHAILGRHRTDDSRKGWISGLDEQEGKLHPTKGGLRIGKEMSERRPGDPYDEQLEWDREGQYYHYLTKWMHVLNRMRRFTGDLTYTRWAIELAKTAHAGFTYVPPFGDQKRMYWKMSIDLTYPLVSSMGHHDPLDGFITYLQLQATGAKDSQTSKALDLSEEITDMATMCEGKSWATDDPLGLGELLSSAYKLAQLILHEGFEHVDLLEILLDAARIGLLSYERRNPLKLPSDYRLAFRELGLSIGLHAIEKLRELIRQTPYDSTMKHHLHARVERLMRYAALGDIIETHWLKPINRHADSWIAHRDINMVMLATSLAPEGYLSI
ncbi:MAG TPA: hypothetical protein DDY17_03065 [Syntrophaceae bacterium]|jgi:hypothetical protein|nr:hypothetical protein [Syntrophaceae bacterium]